MKKSLSILFVLIGVLVGCAPDSIKTTKPVGAEDPPPPGTIDNNALDIKVLYSKIELPTKSSIGGLAPLLQDQQGAQIGNLTIFPHEGLEQYGIELWVTDGTAQGTKQLKDIYPGPFSSNPYSFIAHNNHVYFVADDGVHGAELWRTNGTPEGTKLVADIYPGTQKSNIAQLTPMGPDLFFLADNGTIGRELYKIKGEGVELVKDIHPLTTSNITGLTAIKAPDGTYALYFAANDGSGSEPWRSLGTADKTRRLADLVTGTGGSSPSGFTILGSDVYFSAYRPETGFELYKTNVYSTTIDGDKEFVNISPDTTNTTSSSPSGLKQFGNKIYFRAHTPATGSELFETDGTVAGTKMVVDFGATTTSGSCIPLTVALNSLFMTCVTSGFGQELYKLNDAKDGVELVKDIYPGTGSSNITSMGIVNGKLILRALDINAGFEAWATDGTSLGTYLLSDFAAGSNSGVPNSLVPIAGNKGLIRVSTGGFASKLFITDGTKAGTKDFHVINRRLVDNGVFIGETYFFGAKTVRAGSALWRTDGTTAGTRVVHELRSTVADSMMFMSRKNSDSTFYFGVNDATQASTSVWKTDGSSEGTQQAASTLLSYGYLTNSQSGSDTITVGDTFYYQSGGADVGNRRIYMTKGVRNTSVQVPGVNLFIPSSFTRFKDAIYVSGFSVTHGVELFRIPDNTETIELAADVYLGTNGSEPIGLQTNKDFLLYLAKPGAENQMQLFAMGSDRISTPIKSMTEGSTLLRKKMFNFNNKVYFGLLRPDNNIEIWESDGTTVGTRIIDFAATAPNDVVAISDILYVNSQIMFIAAHKSGKSSMYLAKGEGPLESVGTFDKNLEVDLNTVVEVNDKLFYTANNQKVGFELYWHNGEVSAFIDVVEGPVGSYPSVIGKNSKYLFIAADVGQGTTLLTIPWDEL